MLINTLCVINWARKAHTGSLRVYITSKYDSLLSPAKRLCVSFLVRAHTGVNQWGLSLSLSQKSEDKKKKKARFTITRKHVSPSF